MVDGRHKSEWTRTASLGASFHLTITGQKIDPLSLIPERYRPTRPAKARIPIPEELAREGEFGWRLLDKFFEGK